MLGYCGTGVLFFLCLCLLRNTSFPLCSKWYTCLCVCLCACLGLHRCLCLRHCALLNYLFPIVWQVTHVVFWINLSDQPGSIHCSPAVKISKRNNGKEYNFKTGGKWEFLATCKCRGRLLADCAPPWPPPWARFPLLREPRSPRIGGRAGGPTPMLEVILMFGASLCLQFVCFTLQYFIIAIFYLIGFFLKGLSTPRNVRYSSENERQWKNQGLKYFMTDPNVWCFLKLPYSSPVGQ